VLKELKLKMTILALKYRLYPKTSHKKIIKKTIGCCRKVYNLFVEKFIKDFNNKIKYNQSDYSKQLTAWKKMSEYDFLNEVNSQALVAVLQNFNKAVFGFFKNCKNKIKGKKGFPKFKKWSCNGSFQNQNGVSKNDLENPNNKIIWEKGKPFLSIRKIKKIPIVLHRPISIGKIGTVTISLHADEYYASIVVDDGIVPPNPAHVVSETTGGIDFGINSFITEDDGCKTENMRFFEKNQKKLAVLQKRLQKKRDNNPNFKSSKRYRKALLKLSKCHFKILKQRDDFTHKKSDMLLKKYDTIACENLNVAGMSRNLGKSISDVAISATKTKLIYKSVRRGKNILSVDRFFPSSKTCFICGFINKELNRGDKVWDCQKCKTHHDRDVNAAKNIKKQALDDYCKKS
jgi:putative transposase